MRFLNDNQLEAIGYKYIIDNIDTISRLGNDEKYSVKPYTHKKQKELIEELENTSTMTELLESNQDLIDDICLSLHKIKDIKTTIKKIGTGTILDEVELFEIKSFSATCTNIIKSINKLENPIKAFQLHPLDEVFRFLDPDQTNFETFYIYDSYSQDLKELRYRRKELEKQIFCLEYEESKDELLLKRVEILELENEIEYQIKVDLTGKLLPFSQRMLDNTAAIGYLDFLIAKTKYFAATKANKPDIISDMDTISLENVYNPYYDQLLKKKNASMQCLNINLKAGVTVLTGANMGGKSIAMKTVALNVLLANCGMYVYAETAAIPIIEFLYMISDDLQSVEKGLSTFGAEMIQLKTILGASKVKDGLIILDELARGTNPEEAKIIVNSVIEFFRNKSSYTFISTHFDEIIAKGVTHLQVVGINKVNFEKLEQSAKINNKEALKLLRKQMDYSIEEVSDSFVPKNALQIARLLGISDLKFDLYNKE